ncbi:MAG: DUF1653 domain-containing protein [bacterium]|nr:DUF1653 domain-containing protein [bacterium]
MTIKKEILKKALDRASAEIHSRPDWMKPVRSQGGDNIDKDITNLSLEILQKEVMRLRQIIRAHRDTNGDDRCWKDDDLLYKLLPEEECKLNEFTHEEKAILMARCSRFWDTRRYPANQGKVHEWGSVARQGLYRHFKGGLYLVHGVALNSETGEREVVYRPLCGSFELMVRSEKSFIEEVDKSEFNYKGPRFQFVSEMS